MGKIVYTPVSTPASGGRVTYETMGLPTPLRGDSADCIHLL